MRKPFVTLVFFVLFLYGHGFAFVSQVIATPSSQSSPVREISEEETLYRYFGAATVLRRVGRHEEALEILRYILDKKPHDDYVKSYAEDVKDEMGEQKRKWTVDNKSAARRLRKKKIKALIRDGVLHYKSENFDEALLMFSDALSLSSSNSTAKRYMRKLKKHYDKELRIENLAHDSEAGYDPAGNGADGIDLQYITLSKRADSLLDQTELGYKIEEIIASRKAEEKRSRELTVGPGDLLQVGVLDHPELSGQVEVRVNGEIVIPLVNDLIMAKDLTLGELTESVTKTMKRYVQDPHVNISAIEYKSKSYYVVDEVGSTPYPIPRADFTLRDALFSADWGDNRALGRVIITKPAARHPIVKKVDAFDLVYRGKLENDVRIEDGDVIYVPMTFAAKTTKTIQDLLGPFRAIRQARDLYLNMKSNEKDWQKIFRLPPDYDRQPEDGKDVLLENISLRDYIVTR